MEKSNETDDHQYGVFEVVVSHPMGGSNCSNNSGNTEELLVKFLGMASDVTTKTIPPVDEALATHACCKIGILRPTLDAAPRNQKPWVYVWDCEELHQIGSDRIDGLIVWEPCDFFMSIPLEALAPAIRPGGSLLFIKPEALGDSSCSIERHASDPERGLFKNVDCGRASDSLLLNLLSLIEKGIIPHGSIFVPAELGGATEMVEGGRGTWDNSRSQTITVVDGGYEIPVPYNKLGLLIRTQKECTKSVLGKLSKPIPSFIDGWQEQYPFLLNLIAGRQEMFEESIAVKSWIPWPEEDLCRYGSEMSGWKVFPLCSCIPSNNLENFKWIERYCTACPKTVAMLRNIVPLRTALFSRLGAKTTIPSHRGWDIVANHVLRCLVPIMLPSPNSCGICVEGERRVLKEGEVTIFDDSKLHMAYNDDPMSERIILIIDIERPDNIRAGCSRGAATRELNDLIESFM